MTTTPHISMTELRERYLRLGKNGKKELVLDVREPEEFSEGHVPGAKNVPHEEVGDYADELRGYDTVYVHCRSGKRSQIAAHILESQGLRNLVCVSEGGMMDWEGAGYEVSTD